MSYDNDDDDDAVTCFDNMRGCEHKAKVKDTKHKAKVKAKNGKMCTEGCPRPRTCAGGIHC